MLVDLRGVEPLTSALRTQTTAITSETGARDTKSRNEGRTEGRTSDGGIGEGSANDERTTQAPPETQRLRASEFWKLTPEERATLAERLAREESPAE